MKKHAPCAPQAGFTLIEIIAVLVILGMLAAVAIPKYQDLQVAAEQKAADGFIAACQSMKTIKYSQTMLEQNGDTAAAATSGLDETCSGVEMSGGFTVTANQGTITVTTPSTATYTGSWAAP